MTDSIRHFYDIDLSFSKNPLSGDIAKKVDVNAVKQSVYDLLMTKTFDMPFHPEIKGGIRQMLFENFSPLTKITVENQIKIVIGNWEPRISVKSVSVSEDLDSNAMKIDVHFYLVNSHVESSFKFYVYRQR